MTDSRLQTPQIASDLAATWRSYLPEHVLHLLLSATNVNNPPVTESGDAVLLYADVAGFTAMTESLSSAGSYGTEQLTRIINQWFAVTADAIASSGGSVVDFAGDALVGMFRYSPETGAAAAGRAIRCAELIRTATASVGPVSTPDGPQSLTIRIGLAGGPTLVMLLGDPAIRLQHVVAGPALDRAITALHEADRGEIVVDQGLRAMAGPPGADEDPSTVPAPPPAELERLLTPFLHPAIRARLRSGRHELVNEHRKVSTAFVRLPDLVIDDPASVQELQRYLAAGVAIIDRYGGHLRHLMADDKGTVLVAVFGTPVSNEDDEERALRCCLELLALPGGPYRGGITTGPVYSGEVGSDIRREYAVVGDAVNLAARLMASAPPGRLLIDQATYERVRDVVVAEGPSAVTAKGKAEPVRVWHVREAREPAPATSVPSPAPGGLVGRARELELLHSLARRVRDGHGQVVWVHGEAGIGKSRVAAEAFRTMQTFGFTGYAGSCRSHGTRAGYRVWRSIWRELLGVDPALPLAQQQAALTKRVARYDGTGQRAPLLAAVINLPMPDTDLTAQLDLVGRDELLRATLVACLRDRVAGGPLVLLLEDCQWIDPASVALLEMIAGQIADLPVLLLATSREPVPAKLAELANLAGLTLTHMPRADTDRLAALRLRERYGPAATVAAQLVHQIAEQAGGNAFYIEELVSYLHGHGIDPADPRAMTAVHVPDSLQRLVMARIDQLTDDEKATVKVASVIGRRFQPPWIASVYPAAGATEQVEEHLHHLHERDLTQPVPDQIEPEHEFKHPITQETAYQSITHETRAALHEKVGRFVEETFADRLSQYVDVLAYHYGRTERTGEQLVWFRAAGDRAKAMYANETATHYYGRLLPLLPRDERAELHVEIGTVHYHTGQWADAEEHYRKGMDLAEEAGRDDILAAGQRQLGDLLMYTHSDAEAVTWLTRALDGFERIGDIVGQSRTMNRMTFALYRQGAYAEALDLGLRHLAMAAAAGDLSAMSTALNHIGLVHLNSGRLDAALDHLRRSLATAERAGDRHSTLNAACNLGWGYVRRADLIEAFASYRQALTVAQDIGARHTGSVIIGNLSEIYREVGDLGAARVCAMQALRVAVELGDWTSVADQLAHLGAIAAAEDDAEDAARLLGRAIELSRQLEAPYLLCEWLHRLARVELAAGRPDEAERLNSEALHIAEEHDERNTQVISYALAVRLRVTAGRLDAGSAAEQLRKATGKWNEAHEVAVLLDAAWQLDPADTDARETAAVIYRGLCERAPTVEHRHAYRRLSGADLPPGPQLPPLPDWIAAEEGPDLEALLERITRLRRPEPV
ncbi:tetratricopeptide repeat protein [Paractinoplanes rishiriensis]|uniref:tetratricopeptide repeat protein n=1 Tax=Paractinoplanes rishiriensis TaxID=1050105 RepID=UPI00194342A1|nr:tetratricopeptide repeat protein [Actinoplanes rishiriensis]